MVKGSVKLEFLENLQTERKRTVEEDEEDPVDRKDWLLMMKSRRSLIHLYTPASLHITLLPIPIRFAHLMILDHHHRSNNTSFTLTHSHTHAFPWLHMGIRKTFVPSVLLTYPLDYAYFLKPNQGGKLQGLSRYYM